jgi:hypothetical protein
MAEEQLATFAFLEKMDALRGARDTENAMIGAQERYDKLKAASKDTAAIIENYRDRLLQKQEAGDTSNDHMIDDDDLVLAAGQVEYAEMMDDERIMLDQGFLILTAITAEKTDVNNTALKTAEKAEYTNQLARMSLDIDGEPRA